ncbi:MAG: HAD family hydrolase [Myxococcales bacterium]
MIPSDIGGVLFDLDGTLYAHSRRLKLFMALACARDLGLLRRLSSVRRELAGRAFATEAAFFEAHHRLLAERCGVSPGRARRFYDERFLPALVELLRRHARARPGLVERFRELGARGVACCVLSDHGRIEERLEALGIAPRLFAACASSTESGALKPAPAPFLRMAERLGIPPPRWLVVGDRADTDAAGAAAAGMAFLGIGDRAAAAGFEPWPRVLERLAEIGREASRSAEPAGAADARAPRSADAG